MMSSSHYADCNHLVNWYRLRSVNYEDELSILDRKITVPVLFIQALRDAALPPAMGGSMKTHFANLTVEQVNTGHWASWEDPVGINKILSTWLNTQIPESAGSNL